MGIPMRVTTAGRFETPRAEGDSQEGGKAGRIGIGFSSRLPAFLFVCLSAVVPACGGHAAAVKLPTFETPGQSKCSVTSSQSRPLIVEWPSADRGALEAQA